MKKLFSLLLLFFNWHIIYAQTPSICCNASATEKFATNASDEYFIMSHATPLPYTFTSEKGQDILYKASDGSNAHAWEIKSDKKTPYYIFVIHEWWGLNDYIKRESEKLADELGVNVLALDLYDKQVATTREDAAKYLQNVKSERALAIIRGAYAYVGENTKVFTIGWCFGGGWSLQAALEGGKQVVGCVMYYGQPEKNVTRLKTLNSDVIGFFADKDQWITPEVVDEFKENMEEAGKKLIVHHYDADHAFANPSNPDYDKAAAADAYNKTLAFVRERME